MSDTARFSRSASVGIQALCYVAAIAVAIGVGCLARSLHPLWIVLIADIGATVAIFAFAYALKNSSLYDPYWSVQPIVIAGFWFYWASDSEIVWLRAGLAAGLLTLWGIRLTANFFYGWKGLHEQDWRYDDLHEQHGSRYWLVSFSGIMMFPTGLVYLGCLPLWPAIATGTTPFGAWDIAGAVVMVVALYFETFSDVQLHRFAASNTISGKTLDTGLWSISRHPNYLGEILTWWGLALFGIGAGGPWWILSGALAITILFVFISIPMIEKRHHRRRSDYADYCDRVPMLVPGLRFPR